jgi:putative addiction module component
MNDRVRTILDQARQLTAKERQELLDLFEVEFASDSEGTPEEVEAAWLDEVERRIEAAERDGTTFIDFDEAMRRARERIH